MSSYDQLDYAALYRSVNRDKPAEDPAKARGFMRGAADLGLEAASGVTRGVGMLANVFGANNPVSQGARSADEFIRAYLSAQSKQDSASAAAILAEAEDAGIGDQVAAGLRAFAQNPVSTTVNALGQAVPVIAGALIPGMGPATVAGRVGMAGIGAAQGAGSVKGAIFEGVKSEQMRQPGMTEADATAAAEQAQAYGGQNTGNILGGAALGGVAGSTGFQPAAARLLAGRGMLSQATEQVEQSMLRRLGADKLSDVAETRAGGALTGALVEGGTEFSQGGQEQYATNVALQREGFDVPTFRGVVSQGVMEAAAGSALGAGFGALDKPKSTKPTIKDIADAPTVDAAIDAFTKVLALPAPATKAQWEVVDGQQLLTGPGQPPAPPPAAPRLPAPTEPPAMMVDQFGNVTTQPASQRAEAISRDNMARADAEQAAAAQRQRTQQLGKQTPRGEGPAERIPTGDATSVDYIPSGDATEFEFVPTGDATEVQAETIQADDFVTGDGMPYGTKSGANMRARKEGLGPANVLQVAGGWIVRPQPTAMSPAGQEVQPNNTRGTRAGDVLKAPDVNQPDVDRATGLAAGAADGPGVDAGGSRRDSRPDPVADGRMAGPTATPSPGSGTPVPVGSGARPDAALIPAEGTPLTLDGKPYTVAAAGKRYVTLADANGKERVISDGSFLWPRVQAALNPAILGNSQDGAPVKETGQNLSPANATAPQQTPQAARAEAPAPAATAGAAGQAAADTGAASGGAVEAGGLKKLRDAVKRARPFTDQHLKAIRALKEAATVDAEGAIAAGEAPVYASSTGLTAVITPSAQQPGMFQVTRYNSTGAIGDSQYKTIAQAIDDNQLQDIDRLPAPAAEKHMQELTDAEAEYQRKRAERDAAPKTAAPVQPQAQAEAPVAEPAGAATPVVEPKAKPTVYKTRRAAEEAKAGNTQRIRKTKDGYILRDATDKELAAAEKAGRRLANSGVDVEKDSLLVAIAKLGGLNISERSDTIGEGNRNIGGKMLFTSAGQALDTLADGALREYGYVPQQEVNRDGGVRWLRDAIKAEFNNGTQNFSEQGMEAIMQREQAQQEAEFLASQEAEDIFGDLTGDEVQATGYTAASPEVQAATEQAVAEAMAQGVDVETVRERVSMQSEGLTQDEYEIAVQQALAEAVAQARGDAQRAETVAAGRGAENRSQGAGGQGSGQEEGLTSVQSFTPADVEQQALLNAQTEEELRARDKRNEDARKADAAEQKRLADKAIADAELGEFTLTGSDRAVDVGAAAGQGGLFDGPAEPAPLYASRPLTPASANAIRAWAASQGFKTTLPAADMHVTVAYSRDPVDGATVPADAKALTVPAGKRTVEPLGDQGAVVLKFDSPALQARWKQYRDAGASWDYESYTPHVTLTYDGAGVDLKTVEPYTGPIELAAETQEPLNVDKADDYKEAGEDPTPQSAADKPAAEVQAPKAAAKIADFGEKLEGARKDYATKLKDAESVDIAAEPLSKSWPEPDYEKLLAGGADPYSVAFVRAARDEVPTKPQKAWKLKGWVASVEVLRGASSKLLSGEVSKDRVQSLLENDAFRNVREIVGSRAELYELVGHKQSLKGISFAKNQYMMYKGEKDVTKWVVEQKTKATAFSNWPRELAVADTKAAMLDQFMARFMATTLGDDGTPAPKAPNKGQFSIYRKRGTPGAFIGKKIGREYIDLHKADDVAAARKYLNERTADLEAALAKYKETPFERKAENQPRVGDDHRNGAPVTPDVFADTFGFRGVQFGNYVEQGRRQSDLNQAFDALMDMAAVLGVPPRAISLNGRLGLAFGARGRGGNNAPAAHYEPGNVVINLTKGSGPGSLGHEWWHAVDNYFGNEFGAGGFATDGVRTDRLRDEMKAAFKSVMTATQAPPLRRRAAELDKRRSKPYWNTPLELSARAYESYLIAKLQDQGAANDYLANVVDEKVWNISESARATFFGGDPNVETYPYPGQAELPAVRAAFDDFFRIVETRADDAGNVALYSRTGAAPDEAAALQALSENDDLFALPKSEAVTLREIGLDIAPQIVVSKAPTMAGTSETWNITMPTGEVGKLYVRKPNPFGPTVYGFDLNEGEISGAYEGRPGTNPDDVDPDTEDVYIDVSKLQPGQGGNQVYAMAAAYAHNTGRIFIGDPAGLSDDAMRRRSENMLSSALRYGTTRHLAPHPRQEAGAKSIGVPPLQWTYGDDLGNIRRLIDVNVKALENAFPAAKKIDFDADTGQFRNADTGAVIERSAIERAARERRRGLDERLAGAGVARVAGVQSALRGASAGGSTIARGAVWRALSREEGTGSQGSGRRNGLLVRLAQLGAQSVPGLNRLFSRPAAGATTAADLRTALEAEFTPETIGALERAGLLTIADRPGRGMPADAAGVTRRDGSMELFAANTAQSSTAVAYHEALHATLRSTIGEDTFKALMDRLAKIDRAASNSSGEVNRFFREAAGRIPEDVTGEARTEELAAYSVEVYQSNRERMPSTLRRWVEDLMAALRAGLAKALQVAGVGVRVRARLLADPATLQRLARDGLQFMARQGMGDNAAMAFSRAYHGTPYRGIERFDTSKIGTGEGAQSFGWGLYFASKKEIAEHYRKTLGGAEFDYADEATRERMRRLTNFDDWLWKHIGDTAHDADFDPAKTATALRAYAARYSGSRDAVREIAGLVEDGKLIPKPGGQLYEVEVPEDSELLHWERPLSKQPDAVREALAPFLERYQASQRKIMSAFPEAEVEREIQASQKTITGQEIYEQAGYMEGGGDRSASEYLRGLGIRGIKYLDATSRDGSGGSSNYVIFSGDDVQIQGAMYSRAAAATASAANPNASPGTGWAMPEGTKFDDFVYKYQDKNVDLKRAIAGITKDRQALEDNIDAYLQEELFHERAAKRTQDFTKDELGPIMKDMAQRGITLEALDEYLHNRHAEEANKVAAERNKDAAGNSTMPDGGSGIKTADARAYLAGLDPSKRKRLEAAAAKIDAIIAKTRQTLVDYGLESQTVVDGWGAQFDHYVPLMREDEGGGMGTGQGFSVKGKESKSRTGSTDRKVVDILANIAMQRERAIVRGEKNRVAVAMVGLVDANPAPDFWQADYIPTERVFNERTGLVEERQILGFKNRPNVLVAKVAGPNGEVQERAIVFNERNPRAVRMAESLKNLDAAQLEGLLGVSAKITRYFAAINTQYNPIFGFVNFIRDVQGAIINLQSTALKGSEKDVMKGVVPALAGVYADTRKARQGKAATSPWSALWEEFQNEGGATGFRDLFRTSEDRANAIKREIDPTAWMDSPLGKVFTANGNLKVPLAQAQKGATWLFDWLSDYNLAMENAVRLSAYKTALDGGMTKPRAASLAKNLTVNFNRKGQAGMQAGAVYAFFNAAMQGTARMGDVLFEGQGPSQRLSGLGRKIIYGGMALGAMQAMALAAAGFDEDEPPPFVRERSLVIPIGALAGGKEYISIPMPLGWHVIPGVGREATEFALSGFKDPGKRLAGLVALFADAFNPIGNAGMSLQTIAPTALDPLVALAENRDWTGKPIARESFDHTTPGHMLAKDTASAASKWLAETINLMSGGTAYTRGAISPTPDQIDYLWGQVTGGVGRELSKVEQTATAALTGESLPTHKVPLVGRFFGDAEGPTGQATRFYTNLNQINMHEAQIKGLVKDGLTDEAQRYRAENSEASLISVANMAERQVRRLRARKRELLSKDAPREAITAIEEQITQAMTRFNEAVQRREAAPV